VENNSHQHTRHGIEDERSYDATDSANITITVKCKINGFDKEVKVKKFYDCLTREKGNESWIEISDDFQWKEVAGENYQQILKHEGKIVAVLHEESAMKMIKGAQLGPMEIFQKNKQIQTRPAGLYVSKSLTEEEKQQAIGIMACCSQRFVSACELKVEYEPAESGSMQSYMMTAMTQTGHDGSVH